MTDVDTLKQLAYNEGLECADVLSREDAWTIEDDNEEVTAAFRQGWLDGQHT